MRIKKIQLKNGYKRFHDLTIDLGSDPKRIIALVGPNGCGKSSVFDGMLYLNSTRGQIGKQDYKNPRDYKYHSMFQDSSFNQNNVTIEFNGGNFQTIVNSKASKGNTIFSFRSPYRYNSNLKVKETKAISDIN